MNITKSYVYPNTRFGINPKHLFFKLSILMALLAVGCGGGAPQEIQVIVVTETPAPTAVVIEETTSEETQAEAEVESEPTPTAESEVVVASDEAEPATVAPIADQPAFQLVDTDSYFRLTSMWLENENRCWESGPGRDENALLGGASFMDSCQDVSSQLWKFIPSEDEGYYHLTSQSKENEFRLESGDGENIPTYLDNSQDVSGQFWKIVESEEDGYYRLTSMFMETENRCLESGPGPDDGYPFGGATNMAPCENVSGQLWSLTAVDGVAAEEAPAAAEEEPSDLEVLQMLCDDTSPADTANGYTVGVRFVNVSGGSVDVSWRDATLETAGEYESWITLADEEIFDNGENWPGVDYKFSYANGQEYSWIIGGTSTQCIFLVEDEIGSFAVPITADGADSVVLAPEYVSTAGGSAETPTETTEDPAPTNTPEPAAEAPTSTPEPAPAATEAPAQAVAVTGPIDSATYCSDFGPIPADRTGDSRLRIVNLTSNAIPVAITNADDDGVTDRVVEPNILDQMWNTFEGKTGKFDLPSGPYTHTARNGDCILITEEGVTVVPDGVTTTIEAKSAAVAAACESIYEKPSTDRNTTVKLVNLTSSPLDFSVQSVTDGQMTSPRPLNQHATFPLGAHWRTIDGYKAEATLPSGKYTQTASDGNCLVFNDDGSITTLTTSVATVPTNDQLCVGIGAPEAGFDVQLRFVNRTGSPIGFAWKGAGTSSYVTDYRDINPYEWTYNSDAKVGDTYQLTLASGPYEYTVGSSNACVIIEDSGVTVK